MHIFIDGEDMGPAATAVAKVHTRKDIHGQICWAPAPSFSIFFSSFQNVYAVLDLYGRITAMSIVSSSVMEDTESVKAPSLCSESCSEGEEDSTPVREVGDGREPRPRSASERPGPHFTSYCRQAESEPCAPVPTVMAFLENHGKNIQLSNQNLTAARVSSYNQGLLVTAQPLARQQLFQVPPGSDQLICWNKSLGLTETEIQLYKTLSLSSFFSSLLLLYYWML